MAGLEKGPESAGTPAIFLPPRGVGRPRSPRAARPRIAGYGGRGRGRERRTPSGAGALAWGWGVCGAYETGVPYAVSGNAISEEDR